MTFTRLIGIVAVLAVLAAVSAGPASAASLPAGTTAILSGDSSLMAPFSAPVASSETRSSAVSQDGRFVAFQSRSDGLYEGDDDSVSNVYVKDRMAGTIILASRASGAEGEPAHAWCYLPSISDDGTKVAFTCEGPLDPADTNAPGTDVYVRDLQTSTTRLVSRAGNLGAVGNAGSTSASISETGEYVAFQSESSNLDPAATSRAMRVYRRHVGGANETILVSRKTGATGGVVGGREPSISDDGNRIAFTSEPNEAIDPADNNTAVDVYVRDISAGTTVLASRADGSGDVGNGTSFASAIAGNGGSVAFESTANQFDNDADSDTKPDIYRRELAVKTTALVSITAGGDKGITSTRPSIDDSGNVVAFVSSATGLDPDDTDPTRDAYVKNLATNQMQVVSRRDGAAGKVANASAAAVAVSGDGTKVGIGTDSGSIAPDLDPRHSAVVLRDLVAPNRTDPVSRPAGTGPFANQGGFAYGGALSADGRYAAFLSGAPALGLPDGTDKAVFVRDRVTGAVVLASRADGVDGTPLPVNDNTPDISADGRRVAFLVADGQATSVWVRDLPTGRTFLASRADGPEGEPANATSYGATLDADGSRVAFSTGASNLGDGDGDHQADVHVRDLESGRTILASRGADGAKGNGESSATDINADGTRVAFVSYATNLADGDTDTEPDVHLRDLGADTTVLVSANPGGEKSNGSAGWATMDASGTRIAFDAVASNLPGGSGSHLSVFVRDLAAGTLVLASRADGADGAPGTADSDSAVISPDGGYVAFASGAANLAPGLPAGAAETYVRDLAGGHTELISRATGVDGQVAERGGSSPGGVSTGGACVSFWNDDALVGPDSDYGQVYLRVRQADCATGQDAGGARDTIAPVLSGARLTRKRFRVGRARTPLTARVRRGTVLRFRSTEAGAASVTFSRIVRGRAGRTRARRAGRITRRVAAGQVRIALSGRLGRRPMRAGRYRLTLQMRDAAGNVSRPVRLKFRVAR
jgi:Tol biopolymer transport system component